jgi:hypothetical protein
MSVCISQFFRQRAIELLNSFTNRLDVVAIAPDGQVIDGLPVTAVRNPNADTVAQFNANQVWPTNHVKTEYAVSVHRKFPHSKSRHMPAPQKTKLRAPKTQNRTPLTQSCRVLFSFGGGAERNTTPPPIPARHRDCAETQMKSRDLPDAEITFTAVTRGW